LTKLQERKDIRTGESSNRKSAPTQKSDSEGENFGEEKGKCKTFLVVRKTEGVKRGVGSIKPGGAGKRLFANTRGGIGPCSREGLPAEKVAEGHNANGRD